MKLAKMLSRRRGVGGLALMLAGLAAAQSGAPVPIKAGLWEMSVSMARKMTLPPDAEARIAAMPPAQQEQVRSMMGGASQPTVTTRKVCSNGTTSMDGLISQGQQNPMMQCTYSNKVQTPKGGSFDVSCVSTQGPGAKGHFEFHMVDADHVAGTSHLAISGMGAGAAQGGMSMEISTTGKYVGADCGDVKPYVPPAAAQ